MPSPYEINSQRYRAAESAADYEPEH